jgi:hypothetical protein
MTLKEKFIDAFKSGKRFDIQNAETIADEFAIEFAEWITSEKSKYSIMYGNQNKRFADFDKEYTSKELLEIFKKEKGL